MPLLRLPHHNTTMYTQFIIARYCLFARVKGCICVVTISLARTQKGSFTHVKGFIYFSRELCCGRKLGLLRTQHPCNCLFHS